MHDGVCLDSMIFSPDSRRFAYIAMRGKRQFVVLDGVAGNTHEGIAEGTLTFSRAGDHFAYAAFDNGECRIFLDRKECGRADTIASDLIFSNDGKQLAYVATRNEKYWVEVNGKKGNEYDGVTGNPEFSPDGRRLAYAAARGEAWLVVVDGEESKLYEGVAAVPHFSADGQHVVYVAMEADGHSVVWDDKTFGKYDGILEGLFTLSPSDEHIAYVAQHDGKRSIFVNGVKAECEYDGFPEGSHLVFSEPNTLWIVAYRDEQLYRVEVEIPE